nr:MAG TPA: hypothetical protein [Caudoviricetes sp.]
MAAPDQPIPKRLLALDSRKKNGYRGLAATA